MAKLSILKSPYFLIPLVSTIVSTFINSFLVEFVLPWRRPVQNWMLAHGLGAYAGEYGIFNLYIPCIVLCFAIGAMIGFTNYRNWIRMTLLFGACYLVAPELFNFVVSGTTALGYFSPNVILKALCYEVAAVFPAALTGAWIASKLASRRYKIQLSNAGLCPACEYNLAGNVSGRCPECGRSVQPMTTV